jgi:hypothetical protein
MSNPLVTALRETRAKHELLASFHKGLVDIYEEAIGKADDLAIKFGIEGEADDADTGSNGSTQRRTTVRRQSVRQPRKAAPGERGNMSQAIKAYFDAHGTDAKPKEVIEALGKQGLTVSVGLVSSIKTKLRKDGAPAKRRGTSNDSAKRSKSATAAADSSLPLPAIVQDALSDNPDGLKLDELAVECINRGYVYTGKAKGAAKSKAISQNVYQTVNDLMKKKDRRGFANDAPVVIRDETSHRYKLNPKSKKKGAA